MDKKIKDNWLLLIISGVMVIFVFTFIVSEFEVLEDEYYDYTFDEAVEMQMNNNTDDLKIEDGSMTAATEDDVQEAMDIETSHDLEFLELTNHAELTAEEADELLEGRGILEGQGDSFIEAQETYGVNAIYLISHAQVETGNGGSELAQGISPEDSDNTYYNFFGIGAFDRQAIESGSIHARQAEWTSPEEAIYGGAEFIRDNYFDNGQITLYEMRWNPDNPGSHLYATDISWANAIARIMESHYQSIGITPGDINYEYYKEEETE